MKIILYLIALIMVIFSLFLEKGAWASNDVNQIQFDGDRLSVHAKGIALDELLRDVANLTGIQFRFDALAGQTKVFCDFAELNLLDGVRKIIRHLNSAVIYNGPGKIEMVCVFGKSTVSSRTAPWECRYDTVKNSGPDAFEEETRPDELLHPEEEMSDLENPRSVSTPEPAFPDEPPAEEILIDE